MMYRGRTGYLHKKFLDGFDELSSAMPHVAGSKGFYGEMSGDVGLPEADGASLDRSSTLDSRLQEAKSRETQERDDRGMDRE
jgi:hypothetical protein